MRNFWIFMKAFKIGPDLTILTTRHSIHFQGGNFLRHENAQKSKTFQSSLSRRILPACPQDVQKPDSMRKFALAQGFCLRRNGRTE
jgi:hypothetical protein